MVLLKYSTEYAEVSSEWSVNVPKEKRISTIIGVEVHIKDIVEPMREEDLINHLADTERQNKERITDSFTIKQLDSAFFKETLSEISGYRIALKDSNFKTVENLISYRDNKNKKITKQHLMHLADEHPENKFSIAAGLIGLETKNPD